MKKIAVLLFTILSVIIAKDAPNIASKDVILKKGVYANLEEIINNSPSISDSGVILNRTSNTDERYHAVYELRITKENGKTKPFKTNFIGYCDGIKVFVKDVSQSHFSKKLKELEIMPKYSLLNTTIHKMGYKGATSKENSMMAEIEEQHYYLLEMKKMQFENLTPVLVKHLLLRNDPILYNKFTDKTPSSEVLADYIREIQK